MAPSASYRWRGRARMQQGQPPRPPRPSPAVRALSDPCAADQQPHHHPAPCSFLLAQFSSARRYLSIAPSLGLAETALRRFKAAARAMRTFDALQNLSAHGLESLQLLVDGAQLQVGVLDG